MNKNNLLISCTYYIPNISGVSIYSMLLAQWFAKNDYEVTVLTSGFLRTLKKTEVVNKVKIIRSPVLLSIGKGIVLPYFFIDSMMAVKNCSTVNCHLPQIESICLAFWAKIFHKKLVVTHHCEFGFDGPVSNRIVALLSFPFHFFTYLLADKIVAYTKDHANHSTFLRMFKNKIEYILPPVAVGEVDDKEIKRLKDIIDGDKIVGYVGRIAWEKGLNYLIEAFGIVRKKIRAKLVLVGPYQNVVGDKSFEKLKPMIEANNDIILLGPMAHEKLVNFYKICDCLVLPSTNNLETFGIVQAEAMVSGCPVVASNLPGVRVPVRMTGMGEIAEIGNVTDMAEKIQKVVERGKFSYAKYSKKLRVFTLAITYESYRKIFF